MTNLTLIPAMLEDAPLIHNMQIKAFMALLQKYEDYDTSPANEPLDRVITRLNQDCTDYYMIKLDEAIIGGIRIVNKESFRYRVSPIFILPEHQRKGIAQQVFQLIEQRYSEAKIWELDTIVQELGHCHLYEKLGYRRTGISYVVNDKMTIVFYEKRL